MMILGKFINNEDLAEPNFVQLIDGGYVALEPYIAYIQTYNGDDRCTETYVVIKSGYNIFHIKKADGRLLKPEEANDFVKILAKKNLVELDDYGYAITSSFDITPETIQITNELDEEYNPIPLVVKM